MGNAESGEGPPGSAANRDIGSPGLVGPSMPPARAVPPEGPDGKPRPEAFGALFSTTRDDIAKIEGLPTAAPKDIPPPSDASLNASRQKPPTSSLGVLGKGLQSAQQSAPEEDAASPSVIESARPSTVGPRSSSSKVSKIEASKGSAALAKRKVRKTGNLLPEWEEPVDSDQEREERRIEAEREAGRGYIKFDTGEVENLKAKKYEEATGKQQQDSEDVEVLQSWEQRVLQLEVGPPQSKTQATSDSRSAATSAAPSAAAAQGGSAFWGQRGAGEPAQASQALAHAQQQPQQQPQHAEHINYEELRKFAQEAPACIPIPMDRSWVCFNQEGKWTIGAEEGVLDGTDLQRVSVVATHMDYNISRHDFDVQAELMIDVDEHYTPAAPLKAGLVFRSDGNGNYCVFLVKLVNGRWTASLWQHHRRAHHNNEQPIKHFPTGPDTETHISILPRQFHVFRARAVSNEVNLFLDGQQIATVNLENEGSKVRAVATKSKAGNSWKAHAYFGIVAGFNRVRVRSMMVADLKDYAESLERCKKDLRDEKTRLRKFHVERMAYSCRASRASKLIQDVARFKVELIAQRMRRYKQAEDQRTSNPMRERNLLTWLAVLHFAAKFDDVLHEGNDLEVIQQQFLKKLEPPPLPPPPTEPPNQAEEELHRRYEAARHKYKNEWERAGRIWMGKQEFKKMRDNFDHSTAMNKRAEIASKLKVKAGEVMSEVEHQDNLRRAWILSNDWQTWEDAEDAGAQGSSPSAPGPK